MTGRGRSSKARRGSERDLLERVLRRWAEAGDDATSRAGAVGVRILDNFQSSDPNRIRALANESLPVALSEAGYWIKGEPTPGDPAMFPVATVSLRQRPADAVLELTIRVGLFANSSHPDFGFTVRGWRFESPEPDRRDPSTGEVVPSPRPFPHAQPTLGWYIGSTCMFHAHMGKVEAQGCSASPLPGPVDRWRRTVNETQPGFPLRATTPATQALSVLVSLYGSTRAAKIVEPDEELRRRINSPDFVNVLGR